MEAAVPETHPSEAFLPISKLHTELGPRMDENVEYDTFEDLFTALQQLGRSYGYSTVLRLKNKEKKGRTFLLDCDRGGTNRSVKNPDLHPSKKRKNTGSRKTDCKFRINAKELPTGKLKVIYKEACHNHEPSDVAINHPANRMRLLDVNETAVDIIKTLMSRKTKVSTIKAIMKEDCCIDLTKRYVYILRQRLRNEQLGGLFPIQWLARELEQRNFFYRIETDKDNRVDRLFFVHPDCFKIWKKASDVLLIDATYKTNRFHQPLINICESLGNDMMIPQLALAFVSGEKEADYKWVLECVQEVLKSEEIAFPNCFVTDRELALLNALEDVFPNIPHILCCWHVNMNVVAKTKKFFTVHKDWMEFFQAWQGLIDATTKVEYEKKLATFMKKKQ